MSATEARVLIIEDNDALRVMMFTILRHQPLGVDTAPTLDEAMEKVRGCDYALIVIDMDMPDREGASFLSAFRERRPEATTFVLAVRDPNGEAVIDSAIVSAVLNKPIELDTLADVVRETAAVVPRPEDPLPCPPAESDIRARLNGDAGLATN
jgi:DNA-binding NtrC family response regulator